MNLDIPDPNFRLTLLESLWIAGRAARFDKEAFFRDVVGEPYDPAAAYNNAVDERVRSALLAVPITPAELAGLTLVQWDGGNEVHGLIWENWDGEDESFDVHDLRGIEHCTAVEDIEFTSGSQVTDLSPLAGLSHLRTLMLYGRALPSLEPLRSLPLRALAVVYVDNPENRELLAVLAGRGVDLSGMYAEQRR